MADVHEEFYFSLALFHFGHVGEVALHGVVAADTVRDGLIVAFDFLALESGGSTYSLASVILQNRSNGDDSLLFRIFCGV